jgi:hypothetical protein
MTLPITIPYTFANATSSIPLSQLDSDFTTVSNAINGIGNGTNSLSNVSITGGTIANVTQSGGLMLSPTQRVNNSYPSPAQANQVNVTAAPSGTFNTDSITTAFQGDMVDVTFAVAQSVSGDSTLGTPTTGYKLNPQASVEYTYLLNQSGWNQQTGGNDGRTSVATHFGKVDNYGQGDTMWGLVYGYVSGAKVGATSFLANPAVTVLAGQVNAGANGVYLNPYEIDLNDRGFDVAGAAWVANLNRTNNTGLLGVFWAGYFVNSIGTQASDAAFAAAGKHKVGLDLTAITLAGNLSAIALVPTQRIYFGSTNTGGLPNGTSPGGSYISESGGVWALTNGSAQLQLSTGQFTIISPALPGTDFAYALGGAANRWQSTWTGALSVKLLATINAATYTVTVFDTSLVFTSTNCTITLPAPATYPGRILVVKVISANTLTSASANVYPQATAVAGTAILSATAGKFAMLQSDGTAWATMMSN